MPEKQVLSLLSCCKTDPWNEKLWKHHWCTEVSICAYAIAKVLEVDCSSLLWHLNNKSNELKNKDVTVIMNYNFIKINYDLDYELQFH